MLLGGGTASAAAAATLRHRGFDGRIVLISGEDVPPYERPPLSKEVLAGTMPPGDTAIRDRDWYRSNDIELVLETWAISIDVDGAAVVTDRAGHVGYDHLVIATGGGRGGCRASRVNASCTCAPGRLGDACLQTAGPR